MARVAVRALHLVNERKVFLYKALSLGFAPARVRPLRAGLQKRACKRATCTSCYPFSSMFPSLSVGLGQVCALYLAPQPYSPPQPSHAVSGRVVGSINNFCLLHFP